MSAPDFHDWKAQSQSFKAFAYYQGGEDSVTVNGSADYAFVYRVTPEFFDVLGARRRQRTFAVEGRIHARRAVSRS